MILKKGIPNNKTRIKINKTIHRYLVGVKLTKSEFNILTQLGIKQ